MTDMTSPARCFIGIDFAVTATHALSIRLEGAAEPAAAVRLPADEPAAIDAFFEALLAKHPEAEFHLAVEGGCPALLRILQRHPRLRIYALNPFSVAAFRKSFHVSGAKSDPVDSDVIRTMLEERVDVLRSCTPGDGHSQHIEQLAADRLGFVHEQVRLGNQLTAAVRRYCPALAGCLQGMPVSLVRLIAEFPGLANLQSRRDATLMKRIRVGARTGESAKRIIQAIRDTPADLDCPVAAMKAGHLAKLYLNIRDTIARYDEQLKAAYAAHPERELGQSLPAGGGILGPQILAKLGTDRSRWGSAQEFACAMGIAPVTIQSGKMRGLVRRRRACNRADQEVFFQYAWCSVRYCDWAKAYYEAKRKAGKKPAAVYRALAYKWIRIIFACWKNHTVYDPAKVVSAFAKTPDATCP